jgi:hypothetical protein
MDMTIKVLLLYGLILIVYELLKSKKPTENEDK